jgi:hypothetical protein
VNRFRVCIPRGNRFVEVSVVCQMAANRGVIAKHFILNRGFARPHRVKKIRLVR